MEGEKINLESMSTVNVFYLVRKFLRFPVSITLLVLLGFSITGCSPSKESMALTTIASFEFENNGRSYTALLLYSDSDPSDKVDVYSYSPLLVCESEKSEKVSIVDEGGRRYSVIYLGKELGEFSDPIILYLDSNNRRLVPIKDHFTFEEYLKRDSLIGLLRNKIP